MIAVPLPGRYDQLRSFLVNPSKVLCVIPVFNSDPPSVDVEVTCSLCGEVDTLIVNLEDPGDLAWLRRSDFYFVCGRHRHLGSN